MSLRGSFAIIGLGAGALAAALLAASWALAGRAAPPKMTAAAVYVLDANTGQVLYRKNERALVRLHSLTKLVTAHVLLQQSGDRLSETVTIKPTYLTTGSSAGLKKGDIWTLQDLLTGMLLVSGNDAALAIADTAGRALLAKEGKRGDPLQRFVKAMNDATASLGAKSARFVDSSGLSPGNFGTAQDVAVIGATVFRDPRLEPVWRCARQTLKISGPAKRTITLDSTIEILGEDGIIGAKTGSHIGKNIYNLAVAWQAPNGDAVIAVTLKSASNAARYDDLRAILAALPRDFPELAVPAPAASKMAAACPERRQKSSGSTP